VCLPSGNAIEYNLTINTALLGSQLYETYTFGAAQTEINGTLNDNVPPPQAMCHTTTQKSEPVHITLLHHNTGIEYAWSEIVATNLTANITQLATTDDGNLITVRMTDAAGFCWWVRINIKERTYQEYGNYKLSSEDGTDNAPRLQHFRSSRKHNTTRDTDIPDSCPPRPQDNVANPALTCDGDVLVYLCNGVLTAGNWPSPSSGSTLRSFLVEPLLGLFLASSRCPCTVSCGHLSLDSQSAIH